MKVIVKNGFKIGINKNISDWVMPNCHQKATIQSRHQNRDTQKTLLQKTKKTIYITPQTPSFEKSKSFDPSSAELPDCLPRLTWDSWVQYRKKINKPIKSQQTVIHAIKLLGKCRENGHQPEEIINASIANGSQGLFEANQPGRTQQAKSHSVTDSFADKDYGEPAAT